MSETMEDGWERPETIDEQRKYSKARQRDREMDAALKANAVHGR